MYNYCRIMDKQTKSKLLLLIIKTLKQSSDNK